jgi:hypothetical protein
VIESSAVIEIVPEPTLRSAVKHTIVELAELFTVSRPTMYRVIDRAKAEFRERIAGALRRPCAARVGEALCGIGCSVTTNPALATRNLIRLGCDLRLCA